MTAAVWIRGFFNDDYGVRPQDMKWFLGGQEEPGRKERVKLDLPPEINVQSIPDDRTLNSMLESGEIDALISARSPSSVLTTAPKSQTAVSQLQGSGDRILQAHEDLSHHAYPGDSQGRV